MVGVLYYDTAALEKMWKCVLQPPTTTLLLHYYHCCCCYCYSSSYYCHSYGQVRAVTPPATIATPMDRYVLNAVLLILSYLIGTCSTPPTIATRMDRYVLNRLHRMLDADPEVDRSVALTIHGRQNVPNMQLELGLNGSKARRSRSNAHAHACARCVHKFVYPHACARCVHMWSHACAQEFTFTLVDPNKKTVWSTELLGDQKVRNTWPSPSP